jgi:hypothetical protein
MTQLTAITYNLRNGGIDAGGDTRLHRQLDLLAWLNPSVLALQFTHRLRRRYGLDLRLYVADMPVTRKVVAGVGRSPRKGDSAGALILALTCRGL